MTISFTTKTCFVCEERSTMQLDAIGLNRWLSGALVQDAFPDMDQAKREQLISGTHPECWDEVFGTAAPETAPEPTTSSLRRRTLRDSRAFFILATVLAAAIGWVMAIAIMLGAD